MHGINAIYVINAANIKQDLTTSSIECLIKFSGRLLVIYNQAAGHVVLCRDDISVDIMPSSGGRTGSCVSLVRLTVYPEYR